MTYSLRIQVSVSLTKVFGTLICAGTLQQQQQSQAWLQKTVDQQSPLFPGGHWQEKHGDPCIRWVVKSQIASKGEMGSHKDTWF